MADEGEKDDGLLEIEDYQIEYSDLAVEKEIDSGCFGAVYKGSYCGTPVAIKAIFDCSNSVVKKLIKREIAALKNMRHPNIVQFMGCSLHNGGVYIVTEFVEGGNLWSRLKDRTKPMPWSTRIKYSLDVCQAIFYLHKRGFVHRDLKSKNLLFDMQSNRLKLCDFGFARTSGRGDDKYMTKTGTGLWMAPEVVLDMPYSEKADIFSFGIIILEVITRKKPPPRVPKDNFGFNVEHLKTLSPPDCPPHFMNLCVACVNLYPEKRPSAEYAQAYLKKLLPAMVEYEK
eukprot:CAMPEP_0119136484 /NCGR_PEP_ID=MMETSP1310-20130426/21507_1 /TAXON_ID=464262 /ORGANISM="Genus nov. species nov., Strain RCC2339" /LENGTH=284 /DNA_ID=CAMNT_0007127473 /DNA_START=36 /DNA_END=887 /DNA_ORIENTATION=+